MSRDIETQFHEADLDTGEYDTLLPEPKSPSKSTRSIRRPRASQEVIQLDDIPPIIKSANGNIFWADEQCTRRVGLTSSEARLFLCLLQTDEPENYNYEQYKALFDDFGREQERLQELVDAVPWWDFNSYRQKAIWEARIQWLERMKEPRLWLLYLMARRRRILKQASMKVLARLREKRLNRANGRRQATFESQRAQPPVMANEASQTSDVQLPEPVAKQTAPIMVSEESQTSETHLNISNARASVTEMLRSSFSTGRHSHSSQGHCPVFDKRFMATREDIRQQVEKLMPKQTPYLVIGWFPRSASDPLERTLQFEDPARLFKALRHGEKDVRGWRRLLSLKALRGFGLYKCDISRGAHLPLVLTTSQKAVLSQFFLAYKASNRHSDDAVAIAWQGWVHRNLNSNKNNPLEGRYSLQLIYEWSSYRLCVIVIVPLVLSFALGLWYMLETGDVVTAWTIALYIVTAAAALVALMTIIGGLKDI